MSALNQSVITIKARTQTLLCKLTLIRIPALTWTEHLTVELTVELSAAQDIEDRLRMMFRVRMRLTHFDPPGALQQIPIDVICSEVREPAAE